MASSSLRILSLLCVLCALCSETACREQGSSTGEARTGQVAAQAGTPIEVRIAPVEKRSVQRGIDVTGTLFGDDETTVSAKAAGRIAAVFKDLGDRVAPGEMLAQIDRTDYELTKVQREAAMHEALARIGLDELPPPDGNFDLSTLPTVLRAHAEESNAKSRLERGKALFEDDPPLISEQEYADLKTALEIASRDVAVEMLAVRALLSQARTRASELAVAEQALVDTEIRAPNPPLPSGEGLGVRAATDINDDRALPHPGPLPQEEGAEFPSPSGRGVRGEGGDNQGRASIAKSAHPHPGPLPMGEGETYAVAQRMVSVGEYVSEGQATFALVDADPIKFRAEVPERYAAAVQVDQRANIFVDAYAEPFVGAMKRISPRVDAASRTFLIEAEIPNGDGRLKPGGFALGRIDTAMEAEVTFVPTSAVVSFAGVRRIFTVEQGKAVEHRIQTGVEIDSSVEILGATLPTDAVVIVEGAAKVSNGAPVAVRDPRVGAARAEAGVRVGS